MGLDAKITNEPEHVGVALHLSHYFPRFVSKGIEYNGEIYYICNITESKPTYLFIEPSGNEHIVDDDIDAGYWACKMYDTLMVSLRYSGSQYLDRFGIERGPLKNLF